MDLAQYDLRLKGGEGAWINIVGPAGQATDLKVKVAGAKSERVDQALKAHNRRLRDAVESKAGNDPDFDKLNEQRDIEVIAAATIDWQNFELNGAPYACTPENVRAIAANPGYDWLTTQIVRATQDAKLFTAP